MNTDELMKRIKQAQARTANLPKTDAPGKTVKFLIIRIDKKKYAFYAEPVREIVMDARIHFVPFVPPYIRGFINRHGDPHTVFDLRCLFENERMDFPIFLVSHFGGDQIAVMATDIVEILKVPVNLVYRISSSTENTNSFFSGALNLRGTEIFILDLSMILSRLEYDLEAV